MMLWAACTLAFFGFLRSGEITVPSDAAFDAACHLTPVDVQLDSRESPALLRVQLKQSKTDPFQVGVMVFVGKTGCLLCPVAAVLSYLSLRATDIGPLFKFADRRALTRQRLVEEVRRALQGIGVDHTVYSGHSFRIGAATAAHAAGLEDSTVRMLGQWEFRCSAKVHQNSSPKPCTALAETNSVAIALFFVCFCCYTRAVSVYIQE